MVIVRIPKRLAAALTGALLVTMALTGIAAASHAEDYTLFGDAMIVAPGSPGNGSERAVQIRSAATVPPGFGGVDFDIPAGTTFEDFTTLATDYWFEADDSC